MFQLITLWVFLFKGILFLGILYFPLTCWRRFISFVFFVLVVSPVVIIFLSLFGSSSDMLEFSSGVWWSFAICSFFTPTDEETYWNLCGGRGGREGLSVGGNSYIVTVWEVSFTKRSLPDLQIGRDAGVWNFGLGPLNYLRELSSIWVGPTGRTPGCKLSESPTTQLADLTWDLVSRPASPLTLSFSQKVPSLCRCPEPGAHTSLEFYREYKPFRL